MCYCALRSLLSRMDHIWNDLMSQGLDIDPVDLVHDPDGVEARSGIALWEHIVSQVTGYGPAGPLLGLTALVIPPLRCVCTPVVSVVVQAE